MRRLTIFAVSLLLAATVWGGDYTKSFTIAQPGEGITEVVIEASVGTVEVAGADVAEISGDVELELDRDEWTARRAERVLGGADLDKEVKGGTLLLRLDRTDDEEQSENWTVRVPRSLAVRIKSGVGDIRVLDVGGDITIKAGVGDIRIEGEYASFGSVGATCGVGDISLRTPEGRDSGEGFISRRLSAKGPGKATIEIEAGVGDVELRLR